MCFDEICIKNGGPILTNRNLKLPVILLFVIVILFGCFSRTEEKIYKKLEEVVKLEEEFKNVQKPLNKLEKKEKRLYEQIVDLGYKEHDKLIELADEAIEISNQRQEYLNEERKSIVTASEKFESVKKQIDKLESQELKKDGLELYAIMEKRYKVYHQLFVQYSKAIQKDKNLYEAFKDKNMRLENLQEKIDDLNRVYKQVYLLNDQFNDLTKKYNEKKLAFYRKAGLIKK